MVRISARRASKAVAPKEITLAAGVLDRHVGRYQFIPGVVISIRRQGTGLMAQITGQGAAEICGVGGAGSSTKS